MFCKEVEDCGHHHHHENKRHRYIFIGILAFIITILVVIFLVWIILQPHKPRFILEDTTIYGLNLSDPNFLSSNMQVTIATKNPNDKVGIFYEKLDIYASYHNQQITLATELPTTYQGHNDFSVWSPFLNGNVVPVSQSLAVSLSQDVNAGFVLLNVKINGNLKWKVGSWLSGKYRIFVNCPAYITLGSQSNGINVGTGIKYQIVQHCHVDV
ncbi:unnamed protein product [Dovyalis caffra]|uniref:Late embryogenesis abundant protein LEA-2 subgroup domain-containing protein n=1 Tax=Dovyalis caffra TaxID=77055 RepID=A0AAV1RAZ4_9ROSI|nr:unnamed protein product [Dovyalis caffra]